MWNMYSIPAAVRLDGRNEPKRKRISHEGGPGPGMGDGAETDAVSTSNSYTDCDG